MTDARPRGSPHGDMRGFRGGGPPGIAGLLRGMEMLRFGFACRLEPPKVVCAMKIRLFPVAFFAALLVAGCGKKENVPATVAAATSSAPAASGASSATPANTGTPAATASTPAAAPSAAAKTAASAPAAGGREIEITANDQMKFSLATIEAKAGEELKIKLTNIGTLPKEAMGHNWVLLKSGNDPMAFAAASMTGRAKSPRARPA